MFRKMIYPIYFLIGSRIVDRKYSLICMNNYILTESRFRSYYDASVIKDSLVYSKKDSLVYSKADRHMFSRS